MGQLKDIAVALGEVTLNLPWRQLIAQVFTFLIYYFIDCDVGVPEFRLLGDLTGFEIKFDKVLDTSRGKMICS